jgi:hypothetical protein
MVTRQLASLDTPDRLSPTDIEVLLAELGGLSSVLSEGATRGDEHLPHPGLHLVYHRADKAVVATTDLGSVLSRLGGVKN